ARHTVRAVLIDALTSEGAVKKRSYPARRGGNGPSVRSRPGMGRAREGSAVVAALALVLLDLVLLRIDRAVVLRGLLAGELLGLVVHQVLAAVRRGGAVLALVLRVRARLVVRVVHR